MDNSIIIEGTIVSKTKSHIVIETKIWLNPETLKVYRFQVDPCQWTDSLSGYISVVGSLRNNIIYALKLDSSFPPDYADHSDLNTIILAGKISAINDGGFTLQYNYHYFIKSDNKIKRCKVLVLSNEAVKIGQKVRVMGRLASDGTRPYILSKNLERISFHGKIKTPVIRHKGERNESQRHL